MPTQKKNSRARRQDLVEEESDRDASALSLDDFEALDPEDYRLYFDRPTRPEGGDEDDDRPALRALGMRGLLAGW